MAATTLVARATGARDPDTAQAAAGQALGLAMGLGLVTPLLVWPFIPTFFALMQCAPEVAAGGTRYLHIILLTSPLAFPLMVATGVMRGGGDTRTPMWITLNMNLFNAGAAAVLIYGYGPLPALGLTGAAIATSVARALGGLAGLWCLFGKRSVIPLHWSGCIVWNRAMISRLLRLALPNLGETVVSRCGHMAFIGIISSLGTLAMAAHQVALCLESLSFMPGWGLSMAATTLAGQRLGAQAPEAAHQAVWRTAGLAVGFMLVVGLGFLLAGPWMAAGFGTDPAVRDLAGLAIRIGASAQPFLALTMVLSGGLRGAGDTRSPLWVTLAAVLLIRIPVVYLFAVVFGWGLAGVWAACTLDWLFRAGLLAWIFQGGAWRKTVV